MSQEGRGCIVADQGGSDKVAQFKIDYFCRIQIQGSDSLSLETNQNIFRRVFKFIDESGRFNHNDENDAYD